MGRKRDTAARVTEPAQHSTVSHYSTTPASASHTAIHSRAGTHPGTQTRSAIWAMGKGLYKGHLLPNSGGMGKPKGGDSESNKVQYSGVQALYYGHVSYSTCTHDAYGTC